MDYSRPILNLNDITDETLVRPSIINRVPQPSELGVLEDSTLTFELVDTNTAQGIDIATLNVVVNGDDAVINGVIQTGWNGSRAVIVPIETWWYRIVLDPTVTPSLTKLTVLMAVDTTDGVSGSWEYYYTIEDKSSPQVLSAKSVDRQKVIVTYGQEIAETDATAVSVTFPWGTEVLSSTLAGWVLDPLTLPITKSLVEPFDVSVGEDLIINVNGSEYTLIITTHLTTALGASTHLNSLLTAQSISADTVYKSGVLYLRSTVQTGSIQVVGGIANHSFKFDNSTYLKMLPYQTTEGEYSLTIIAQYTTGLDSLRTETFTLTNDDLVFTLLGSQEDLSDDSLLVAGNYVLTPNLPLVQSGIKPAFCPDVVSVTLRSSTEVELLLEYDITPDAPYIVTVSNVLDPYGNVVDPDHNSAEFSGFIPVTDSLRSFAIYPEFPEFNRTNDVDKQYSLKRFISVFEEVLNSTLYDVDEFRKNQQLSVAPEDVVDAILYDNGNPFVWFDLNLYEKRKLAYYLVTLMRKKGTEDGIIDAVQLFFQFSVRPTLVLYWGDGWELGSSLLGTETILEPSDLRTKLSFALQVNRSLTATELILLDRVVNVMKASQEHFIGIYVPSSTPALFDFWELGVGLLGYSAYLGE